MESASVAEVAAVGTTGPDSGDDTAPGRVERWRGTMSRGEGRQGHAWAVQVVKHRETDELVGVHIVGARAADMTPEATPA